MAARIGTLCGWTLASVLAATCGRNAAAPSPASLTAGEWQGTTAQGAAIAFTVSSEEILTSLSVGYSFNGCTGTQTFSELAVPTAPDISCIPAPCSPAQQSYRAINFSSGARTGPKTTVNGVFLPGSRAQGVVAFQDYPGCGSVTGVGWTASRR
jgi:hypothetical protein